LFSHVDLIYDLSQLLLRSYRPKCSDKITIISNVLCLMRVSAEMANKLKNRSIFASIARGKDFARVQDGLVGASVTLVSDGVHPVD